MDFGSTEWSLFLRQLQRMFQWLAGAHQVDLPPSTSRIEREVRKNTEQARIASHWRSVHDRTAAVATSLLLCLAPSIGIAQETKNLDRMVVPGHRMVPERWELDNFNAYNFVPSIPSLEVASRYFFTPPTGVPQGNINSVVPKDDPGDCSGKSGAQKPKETAGNPVVLLNGNKIEREIDFVSNGEEGLNLQRAYNHYWAGIGLFGKYWLSNFDLKLTFGSPAVNGCYPRPGGGACGIGANTFIYSLRPDGKAVQYVLKPDGVFYETKNSPVSRIVKQPNGDFILYGEAGQVEVYSSAGYVKSQHNTNGIGWIYSYVNGTYPYRVTHTSGRYVEFVWTGTQLTSVRDPAGNYYGFAYHANQFGSGLHRLAPRSYLTLHQWTKAKP